MKQEYIQHMLINHKDKNWKKAVCRLTFQEKRLNIHFFRAECACQGTEWGTPGLGTFLLASAPNVSIITTVTDGSRCLFGLCLLFFDINRSQTETQTHGYRELTCNRVDLSPLFTLTLESCMKIEVHWRVIDKWTLLKNVLVVLFQSITVKAVPVAQW